MELRLLHYFVTLAEELHFGRAAQRLFISQPPLSVAIRQLEDELRAQLFERSSKGVRLTAAGEHLLERARQLLALSRQAAQETQDVAQGTRGHLRLGFVGSSLYRGLPQALALLQQSHPQVRVDLLEANNRYQQEASEARVALKARFDLVGHLARQKAFSERTFGPGARTKGIVDHIRKELREIEDAPSDIMEWVDVIILAFDGAWRAGWAPQDIVDAIAAKQARNEKRRWPDWRTADPDKAIEHVQGTVDG